MSNFNKNKFQKSGKTKRNFKNKKEKEKDLQEEKGGSAAASREANNPQVGVANDLNGCW